MKKQKQFPKMKNGINKKEFCHFTLLGKLNKTWRACDKASQVGTFGGGGGS